MEFSEPLVLKSKLDIGRTNDCWQNWANFFRLIVINFESCIHFAGLKSE